MKRSCQQVEPASRKSVRSPGLQEQNSARRLVQLRQYSHLNKRETKYMSTALHVKRVTSQVKKAVTAC